MLTYITLRVSKVVLHTRSVCFCCVHASDKCCDASFQFLSHQFVAKYKNLVDNYGMSFGFPLLLVIHVFVQGRRKTDGTLKPFDPSAQYVHPNSRIRMFLNINHGTRRVSARISSAPTVQSSTSDPQSEGFSASGDDDEYMGPHGNTTRGTRSSRPSRLPFSPTKTRSQEVFVVETDEESDYLPSKRIPLRRSTRSSKALRVGLDAGSGDDDSDIHNRSTARSAKKRVKKARKATVRPAYGHIRPIDDTGSEADSEDEAILTKHRHLCEKCHRGPAYDLIADLKRRLKGKGRKRKRTSDDDLEGSDDEMERLHNLGGRVCW